MYLSPSLGRRDVQSPHGELGMRPCGRPGVWSVAEEGAGAGGLSLAAALPLTAWLLAPARLRAPSVKGKQQRPLQKVAAGARQ